MGACGGAGRAPHGWVGGRKAMPHSTDVLRAWGDWLAGGIPETLPRLMEALQPHLGERLVAAEAGAP